MYMFFPSLGAAIPFVIPSRYGAVSQVPVPNERQWNETTRLRMELARAKAVSWFKPWLEIGARGAVHGPVVC